MLLFQQGKIGARELEQVRRRQERLRVPQHRAIVELNYATEEDTWRALAQIQNVELVDLTASPPSPEALKAVPVKFVFHYHMVPYALEGEQLTIAFSELPRPMELGNLRLLLSKRIKVVLATPSSIHALLKKQFGLGAETIQKLREDKNLADGSEEVIFDVKAGDDDSAVDATIARFVDQILVEALRLQATDIHLEPYHASIRLRYRIDGIMHSVPVPEGIRELHGAIVSRLKIMGGLNIAEKRLPHDGRIAMKTGGEEYDLRVSIIPTKYGETVCLRILGRQSLFLDLGQLGMDPLHERLFAQITSLPQGLVLITGPTGSGKTTTLYAALAHANDSTRKIITIEDPVEYQLEGATQIQVREDIGLSFANGLRSMLRHDPDVVLIGEIRDSITAEIAIRAAQTGHLVFSTLHTNDSISAVTRLIEMKIEPFLVGSSLVCSIAQRLTQRICLHCREEDSDLPADLRAEMAAALSISVPEVRAFKGVGCVECSQRGYRGRVAIYEFFLMTDEIADLVEPGVRTGSLRRQARAQGWRSLRDNAWSKVQSGLIPITEQQRLTRQLNLRDWLAGSA
ncbi:MAG TPA: general secretion pathway protein GspE [Verrucomicrobiales bacterium]|nr:general secretion pathway protein GspE [Verrucomicrobiales bacterium]